MSLTVLATVLAKLSAGTVAAKGAVGVAVAAAAITAAGATGVVPIPDRTGGDDTVVSTTSVEEDAEPTEVVEPVVEEGAKAGTFGAAVQEAKADGATGQDIAEMAKSKPLPEQAKRPETAGKPAGKGKPAPVVEEPAAEAPVEAPAGE